MVELWEQAGALINSIHTLDLFSKVVPKQLLIIYKTNPYQVVNRIISGQNTMVSCWGLFLFIVFLGKFITTQSGLRRGIATRLR